MHNYKAGAGVAVQAAEGSASSAGWSREKLPSSCRSRHSTIKQHSRLRKGACSSGRQLLLEEQSVVRKTWGTPWWLLASGGLGAAQELSRCARCISPASGCLGAWIGMETSRTRRGFASRGGVALPCCGRWEADAPSAGGCWIPSSQQRVTDVHGAAVLCSHRRPL